MTDQPHPGMARRLGYVGPNGNELPGEHWNARLIREQAEADKASTPGQGTEVDPDRPHIRIRYATLGGHTHCSVWSVERGGAEVTHGRNGTLIFRVAEFDAFRALIEIGLDTTDHAMGRSAEIEFVEDPHQAGATEDFYTQQAATYDPTKPGYAQGRPVF